MVMHDLEWQYKVTTVLGR